MTIYIVKIKNRVAFEINTGYYLELLRTAKINLLRSIEIKKLKMKMVKIYLIWKVPSVHCNIFNNDYQQDSYTFVNHLANY